MIPYILNQFYLVNFICTGIIFFGLGLSMAWEIEHDLHISHIFPWLRFMSLIPFVPVIHLVKEVPKKLYLPLLLTLCWKIFSFWPLVTFPHIYTSQGWLAEEFVFLNICIHNHYWRIKYTKNPLGLFFKKDFPLFTFNPSRFFVGLPLITLVMILSIFISGGIHSLFMLMESSRGVIHYVDGQLLVKHFTYSKGEKNVYLLGMAHVASESFYQRTLNSIPQLKTIVLLEGVTDNTNLITTPLNYRNLAESLNLSHQHQSFTFKVIESFHTVNADIDFSELPVDIRISLQSVARIANGSLTMSNIKDLKHLSQKRIESDLIHFRNQHLMEVFDSKQQQYDNIVIPWGAAHISDLKRRLVMRGYKLKTEIDSSLISFF